MLGGSRVSPHCSPADHDWSIPPELGISAGRV